MATVTLRVRPGYTHGAHKQFKGGDLFAVDVETASQMLAAFGDKLEQVGEPYVPAGAEPAGAEPAGAEPAGAERGTAVDAAGEDKQPDRQRRRKQRETEAG